MWWEYRKITIGGFNVDQVSNSPHLSHKNYMADTKENYKWDPESQRVINSWNLQKNFCFILFQPIIEKKRMEKAL